MEDQTIGKHCEFPNCLLKDWLNFHCNVCEKNLCKEHYHNEVSCPFNKTNITLNEISKNISKEKKEANLFCSLSTCKRGIFNSIGYECKLCHLIFCLEHRIESEHKCTCVKLSMKDKYIDNKNKFKEKLNQLKKKV